MPKTPLPRFTTKFRIPWSRPKRKLNRSPGGFGVPVVDEPLVVEPVVVEPVVVEPVVVAPVVVD
jgi:hypothetical protein